MDIMANLERLNGKRAQLFKIINSLSPLARNSILKTVNSFSQVQRDEYATQFTRGLFHGMLSGDEYNWLMELVLRHESEIPELDRVFMARLAFELQGLTILKFEEMESPSLLKH